MIWRVEITGAGENIAEVRRCLARENARVGRLKKRVSTDRLAAELALAVPGLSHAAARYEGSTLVVACQQAREGERAGVDGTGRDIVAAREGIIIRISAESGTPQVKAGQAVREGQTLIAGQERTGGGNLRACRAQGEIIARCFARGEARVRLNVTGTVETGEGSPARRFLKARRAGASCRMRRILTGRMSAWSFSRLSGCICPSGGAWRRWRARF